MREVKIRSLQDALSLLEEGSSARRSGMTRMNVHSSRSHSIFTLRLGGYIRGSFFKKNVSMIWGRGEKRRAVCNGKVSFRRLGWLGKSSQNGKQRRQIQRQLKHKTSYSVDS